LNVVVLNSFLSHVFEADAVVKPLCPLANRFCGCFVWAPAPFLLCLVCCCLFCCFLWRNASLAGGFAGRRGLVVLCVFVLFLDFDLPAHMDQLCPCTNVFSTAYAHVRTEP